MAIAGQIQVAFEHHIITELKDSRVRRWECSNQDFGLVCSIHHQWEHDKYFHIWFQH